ncbi:MAG: phage major capsid protein [Devosia sp.]|nr:phage major capsid protein [Devosia sp.]
MAEDTVLEDIQREIKSFGGDVRALRDSMNTDLAAVRKLAEEAKAASERPEIKAQIDALVKSVSEKSGVLESAFNGRMDEVEKKLNRPGATTSAWADSAEGIKAARSFAHSAMSVRGELKGGTKFDDKFDLRAVQDYCEAMQIYLRRGDGAVDVKAMSVGSDPDGGWHVTPAIGTTITGVNFETSPMRAVSNVENISTDAIEYPRDDDEASVGWVGEQEDRPATGTPMGGMQRIPVHELYAMPKATQKLLEDSAFDIEGWLGRKIGDKFGRTEAAAFVNGNGVKKPRGFATYASGAFAAGGSGKIEQVAAATGGAVAWDDLIKLMGALKEFYLGGAVWLMQRASVTSLMLLKDGDGRYIWQPNQQAGKPAVLLGYEVNQAADMDAVAAGKLPIAFGNFKMGYTIVDRVGISTLRDPYTAKPFVQFYTRKRVGGDVTNFEAIKLLAT